MAQTLSDYFKPRTESSRLEIKTTAIETETETECWKIVDLFERKTFLENEVFMPMFADF